MRRFQLIIILLGISSILIAQNSPSYFKTIPADLTDAPAWAVLMYSENPDVVRVENEYLKYYRENPFEKTIHTQNYKHWMMIIDDLVDSNGHINNELTEPEYPTIKTSSDLIWKQIGPLESYNFSEQGGHGVSWQANVYCFDQSVSQPNICFAGIEGGALYKSVDKGLSWQMATKDVSTSTINDVKIAPSDDRIIFFTSSNKIYKSSDGGINWEMIFSIGDRGLQLLIHPSNPDIVFCAANNGFYNSTDGGSNWTKLFSQKSWDVNFQPGNPDIVYLLKTNASAKRCEFFKSTDGGLNFTIRDNGWYVPSDISNANDIGAKIGVTPADPNRVYAALIGESKANDNGWIGMYRSNDSGESWINPNLPDGGPYDVNNHPNPATIDLEGTRFHQGFFNFALAVSHNDPDLVWMGTLSLNKSANGGASWTRIGAYNAQENIGWIHPDIQDLHVLGTDVWVCCDGGINYSTDQLNTHVSRNFGLAGSNYWGFGQGWNEDVMVGGRYHNGNSGYHENYGEGNSLRLGGAEASTGYVNPQFNRKAYFSDISTQILPLNLNGEQTALPKLSLYPNEPYTESNSSEMEFDPRYSDHIYIGNEGKLYKSENGGAFYKALYSFGSSARIHEIEISRSNPDVLYVVSRSGDICSIFRSEDGGESFERVTRLPSSSRWRIEISLNPENENELWAMSITGGNGRKVYRTMDGGQNWENMTTSILDEHRPQDIQFQGGTEGVVYLATMAGVFYFDPDTEDWIDYSEGLPRHTRALESKPFYAKNKIRMATKGHAIWENDMPFRSRPLAQPITQTDSLYTLMDTVYFDSYSIIELEGASFSWSFNPQPLWVSSTSSRNPKVIFGESGSYDVSLEITDQDGIKDQKTIPKMVNLLDLSQVDLIPGDALECYSSGDFATTDMFGLNTEVLSISAWVKPDGIQENYSGIVLNNGESAGINFRGGNNTLGYHWPGGSWSWNSGLVVKPYQWSHVAMVANGDKVTLYVNGVGVDHIADIEPVLIEAFGIGTYKGWESRNFKGMIDEVCIWDKALSEDEIRLNMHLTKEILIDDPTLIGYYQFNEPGGPALNKSGSEHASLYGNSTRVGSSAPVGKGSSFKIDVKEGGEYNFTNTGLNLIFPSHGLLPNGDVLVSRILNKPNILPNDNPGSESYWIIEGFGSDHFSVLSGLEFTFREELSEEILGSVQEAKLWNRRLGSDQNNWIELCPAKSPASDSSLLYDGSCQISGYGQFTIITDKPDMPLFRSQSTGVNIISESTYLPVLYPNPASHGENLQLKINNIERVRLTIHSFEGKLVKDVFLQGADSYIIDQNIIDKGIYLYSIKSDKAIYNGRLVIN